VNVNRKFCYPCSKKLYKPSLENDFVSGGGIPDAAAIHAARKKRELLRAKGGREEYIPLKTSKPAKAPEEEQKKANSKRLVREEDEEEVVVVYIFWQ
jgi:hypothetical protein